jgi:hypothetical protein
MSLSSFVESLSSWRRLAIGFAILWGTLVIIAGGPSALTRTMLSWGIACAAVGQLIGGGTGAILIVELLRAVHPMGAGWTDAKHFKLVGLAWALLAALSLVILVLTTNHAVQGMSE